jgi:hypothetical protein
MAKRTTKRSAKPAAKKTTKSPAKSRSPKTNPAKTRPAQIPPVDIEPDPMEIPPGATRQALDRPIDHGGGAPGSGAGPRHAAADPGSEDETVGRVDMTRNAASPPIEEEDPLEKGPPYASHSGAAVGGTPAQKRSTERAPAHRADADELDSDPAEMASEAALDAEQERFGKREGDVMRLTGYDAIEFAEKQGYLLNKHPDPINGPRTGLSIAEAAALAEEDAELIWLDVGKDEYYRGAPSSFEPDR